MTKRCCDICSKHIEDMCRYYSLRIEKQSPFPTVVDIHDRDVCEPCILAVKAKIRNLATEAK